MNKGKLLFIAAGAFAAAVLTLGALSVALPAGAQTPGDGGPRDRYLELLAQQLGISVDRLKEAQKSARDKMLDEAVARGVITQEAANKLKERPVGALGKIGGFVRGAVHGVLDAAADVLGKSREDVVAGLRNGQSLSEQAAAQGMSRDALKAGLQSRLVAQIRKAQEEGRISQQAADRLIQGLEQHIDKLIDHAHEPGSQPPARNFRFGQR